MTPAILRLEHIADCITPSIHFSVIKRQGKDTSSQKKQARVLFYFEISAWGCSTHKGYENITKSKDLHYLLLAPGI